jgi:hypothetical protein
MSRLDELAASTPIVEHADQVDWDGKPIRKPSGLAGVSIGELYIFMWKLLAAGVAFAVPFVIIFLVIANSH